MGNANKKNKKNDKKEENKQNKQDKQDKDLTKNQAESINSQPIVLEKYKSEKISLKLINKQNHSSSSDTIEEVITYPGLENTIIIACRSGNIKEVNDICSSHDTDYSNVRVLYNFSKRIYSFILLKENSNKLCVGLDNEITILKLNLNDNHSADKEVSISSSDGPIYSLLELKNGNIISAGKNIILWKKKSSIEFTNVSSIPVGNSSIINLVEFPNLNTILATQENTHIIYLLKNEENTISLISELKDISSIWYKGSAQNLSNNFMLLVGKFQLNVIDGKNGVVYSIYPGIDRGTLLNYNKNDNENYWIITSYLGDFLEFYIQDGNDMIYIDKYEFDDKEKIGWGNRLVKINDDNFAAINHYGYIFVFNIQKLST